MPKSNAQKCREYRQKKKESKINITKTSTKRVREFRARRKALLIVQRNTSIAHNNASTEENTENDHQMEQEVEIIIEYNDTLETDPLEEINMKTSNNPTESNSLTTVPAVKSSLTANQNKLDRLVYVSNVEAADDCDSDVANTRPDKLQRYVCKFCVLSYVSVQTLRHHMKQKHPIEAKTLTDIVTNKKRKSIIKCHLCNLIFNNIHELKEHLHLHHTIEDAKCDCDCCKMDSTKEVNAKVKNGTKNKKYVCPICSLALSRKYVLKTHMKTKHELENCYKYSCSFCTYKAPLLHYLDTHIATNHPDTEYAKSQKRHFCNICGYRTSKKCHIEKHKKIHLGEKKFVCNYCDYSTMNEGNLKVHIRTHTKEKPYVCDVSGCDYRCAAKSALKSHKLRHNKESNMIYCDKCNYKTVYRQCLKRHYERHTLR